MNRLLCLAAVAVVALPLAAQPPAAAPTALVLGDQFDRKADLADLRGQVVVVVYGDRKATDACRTLGESLHVCWHPDAKGQPPAKAQAAPVVPLANLKPGQASPNVAVVPVACCGKVPPAIHRIIRTQIAKASPDAVVWLDFGDTLKTMFGQTAGEPNVLVFDATGVLRMKLSGAPDPTAMDALVKSVQALRVEAVK
ncbi:hypothetical protein [Gemmata sp.]|uniref:hypothetical protein n=1 Tax=Gemmata sp. TaxID=1914242 RepID=UPI003F712FA7